MTMPVSGTSACSGTAPANTRRCMRAIPSAMTSTKQPMFLLFLVGWVWTAGFQGSAYGLVGGGIGEATAEEAGGGGGSGGCRGLRRLQL